MHTPIFNNTSAAEKDSHLNVISNGETSFEGNLHVQNAVEGDGTRNFNEKASFHRTKHLKKNQVK